MIDRYPNALRIFVGFNSPENLQYRVAVHSLFEHASIPIHVTRLDLSALRSIGLYLRRTRYDDELGELVDSIDGRPFSTEFAFSRFLVPALCLFEGVALFVDSDFLFRCDVGDLFALYDPGFAVQVVQHDYRPRETVKMRGATQSRYPRKGWSSLVLWNCAHPANGMLTPYRVNHSTGSWLHGFGWLEDDAIGALPPIWNWLAGHHTVEATGEPAAVHFTRGTPDMPEHEGEPFADEWRAVRAAL